MFSWAADVSPMWANSCENLSHQQHQLLRAHSCSNSCPFPVCLNISRGAASAAAAGNCAIHLHSLYAKLQLPGCLRVRWYSIYPRWYPKEGCVNQWAPKPRAVGSCAILVGISKARKHIFHFSDCHFLSTVNAWLYFRTSKISKGWERGTDFDFLPYLWLCSLHTRWL